MHSILLKLISLLLWVTILIEPSPSHSEEEVMKEETECMFGEAIDQEIRAHLTIEEDVTINQAVHSIGNRIIPICDRNGLPFKFVVIKDERINAFSSPGGYIYLTSGLVNFVENENELAGVLAHEIAHVCLRHASKRIKDKNVSLDSHEGVDELARFIVYQKYTIEHEHEADKLGLLYTRRAGFDPTGLATFFERLYASKPRVVFYGLFEKFFQAYIMGPERIKSIRECIAQMESSEGIEEGKKAVSELRTP